MKQQGRADSTVYAGRDSIISHAVSPKEVARIGNVQIYGTRPAPDCVVVAVAPPTNTLTIHHKGTQK